MPAPITPGRAMSPAERKRRSRALARQRADDLGVVEVRVQCPAARRAELEGIAARMVREHHGGHDA